MPGTSNYPSLSGTPNDRIVSLRLVDASGDIKAVVLPVVDEATLGDIAAAVIAYQAITQASIYEVDISSVWRGTPQVANATAQPRFGIENGINLALANTAGNLQTSVRIVAPDPSTMSGNSDVPLKPPLLTFITALLPALPGFGFLTAQYTTRRERKNNTKIR